MQVGGRRRASGEGHRGDDTWKLTGPAGTAPNNTVDEARGDGGDDNGRALQPVAARASDAVVGDVGDGRQCLSAVSSHADVPPAFSAC